MDLLLQPPLSIFTIVGGIVLVFCLIEIILFCFGASLSKLVHHDIAIEADHSVDIDSHSDIFHFGEVPLLVILLSLGTFFTLSGFTIHHITSLFDISVSNLIAIPASIFSASFLTYWTTTIWKKILPSEETYSISLDELLGQEGQVVIGTGDFNQKVQIAIKNKFGETHYMMVKCAIEGLSFQSGDTVTLIEKYEDGSFGAIPKLAGLAQDEQEQEIGKL